MSFFDDITGFVGDAAKWFTGGTTGAAVARISALTLLSRQISESMSKDSEVDVSKYSRLKDREPSTLLETSGSTSGLDAEVSGGTRLQLNPNTDNKIPVLYGSGSFSGDIIDVRLEDNNNTLYAAVALSEVTGTKLSDSSASAYIFNDVFINGERAIFNTDGISVAYTIDSEGNANYNMDGLVEVYCYANGRTNPQVPEYYTNLGLQNADQIMPGWTTRHTMDNLLFAIVKVKYSKDKGVTDIPEFKFTITNSMTLPGDVMYDYMTNTRYGAGLEPSEISAS